MASTFGPNGGAAGGFDGGADGGSLGGPAGGCNGGHFISLFSRLAFRLLPPSERKEPLSISLLYKLNNWEQCKFFQFTPP
jgi:hypothetical protein